MFDLYIPLILFPLSIQLCYAYYLVFFFPGGECDAINKSILLENHVAIRCLFGVLFYMNKREQLNKNALPELYMCSMLETIFYCVMVLSLFFFACSVFCVFLRLGFEVRRAQLLMPRRVQGVKAK